NGAQQNSTRPTPLAGRGPVLPLLIQAPCGAGLRFSLEAALTHASLKLSAAHVGPRQAGSLLLVSAGLQSPDTLPGAAILAHASAKGKGPRPIQQADPRTRRGKEKSPRHQTMPRASVTRPGEPSSGLPREGSSAGP